VKASRGFLAVLLLVATAHAGDPETAAEVTEPGRNVERALDVVLSGTGNASPDVRRSVVLLLDPSASLKGAGFADKAAAALERNAPRLASTAVGVAVAGRKEPVILAPTTDRALVAQAVRDALAKTDDRFQALYADVRAVAAAFRAADGEREIVIVSLENGDLEDDLEATVQAVRREKVKVLVLAREVFLADSYWASHGGKAPPKGTHLTGGDGPWQDLPWGWLWQMTQGNEVAPSGYAAYGLARLATATGGRVFLWGGSASAKHSCSSTGSCLFCSGDDHAPEDERYQSARVRALAPDTGPRDEAFGRAAHDPYVLAVLQAWGSAADAGLIRSRPSVEAAGGTLKPSRRRDASWVPLLGAATGFPRLATKAEESARACEKVLAALETATGRAKEGEGTERSRAAAAYTGLMLRITHANLVGFAAWCREAGPALVARDPEATTPPERPWLDPDRKIAGIGYSNMALCHGVRPFVELHLPGGEATKEELRRLAVAFEAFLSRYGGTPFAVAARRACLARFVPTVQAKNLPPPPRDASSSDEGERVTTPDRPPRDSGAGDTSSGGAVTGGD
jgi:hypothetical protein